MGKSKSIPASSLSSASSPSLTVSTPSYSSSPSEGCSAEVAEALSPNYTTINIFFVTKIILSTQHIFLFLLLSPHSLVLQLNCNTGSPPRIHFGIIFCCLDGTVLTALPSSICISHVAHIQSFSLILISSIRYCGP